MVLSQKPEWIILIFGVLKYETAGLFFGWLSDLGIICHMLSVRRKSYETVTAVAPTKIATIENMVRCQGNYTLLL